MPDEAANPDIFTPHDGAPWLRLPHAAGQAFDLRRLVLAALGLVLLQAGWDILGRVFTGSPGATPEVFQLTGKPPGVSVEMLQSRAWDVAVSAGWRLLEPAQALAAPLRSLFVLGQDVGASVHAFLGMIWAIMVGGLGGGAFARLAVVRASRSSGLSIFGAIRFALRHAAPLIATPLCAIL